MSSGGVSLNDGKDAMVLEFNSIEKTCLFCGQFMCCKARSRNGTCSDWKQELFIGSLLEEIKLDETVLTSTHPACRNFKGKASQEREQILRYMNEFETNRLTTLAQGPSELQTFMPSNPKSIVSK